MGIDLAAPQPRDVFDLRPDDFEGVDAVIHSAALHAPHVGIVPEDRFWRINVEATEHLIRCAAQGGVRRMIYTSTTALYGAGAQATREALWVDEETPAEPQTIYHRTKLAAEQVLRQASVEWGLSVTSLRMSRCFPESIAEMIVYRLHRGVDARDVATAHALALQQSQTGYRCYVVSAKTPFVREDASMLYRDATAVIRHRAPEVAAAFEARHWKLPQRIDRIYDASLAQRVLGWQSHYGAGQLLCAHLENSR